MQTVLLYLSLLLTGIIMNAQNTIEVSLSGMNHDNGEARVGLYNDKGQFLDVTFKSLKSGIENGRANVKFTDIPDGTYAISCYHDEDGNGKLDMLMGMFPKEAYGCSNGAKGFFGPPKWEDAKFTVVNGETKQIEISL